MRLHLLLALLCACGSDISVTEKEDALAVASLCDGRKQADEDAVDSPYDRDEDGFFDASNADCQDAYDPASLDCNDGDPDVNPGVLEQSCNGRDDDCDAGTPDAAEAEIECNGQDDDCNPNTADAPDLDYDGVDACRDCDDSDPDAFPGNTEVCDEGIDNDCDPTTEEECTPDWSGGWVLEGPISYSCAYGLVNISFSEVYVVSTDPTISISSNGGSQPGTMTGTLTDGTEFSVSRSLAGTCTETYTMVGGFIDESHFEATFTASFSGGSWCFDCTTQTWTVYGQR